MLSPLRLPSRSTPATPPPTPTLAQLSRPPASSYFRSMPQRTGIRQITRTATYASIARLSSDITSATRRMLSPSPPRGNTKENATVWSPSLAMPITPRKPLVPLGATLSKAPRRTPDSQQHATFAYGLPSPVSPPSRRPRPSSVRLARLPIPPFATVSSPTRRTNTSSRTGGDHLFTPPRSECATFASAARQVYPTTPTTSGRGTRRLRSSPISPLARKSSSIGLSTFENQCDKEEPLLSAFRSVSLSSSSSLSSSGIDDGLDSLVSSTVLQLYVAGRDVPALFSTTSPLAKMVQQAREEHGPRKGKIRQPTVNVQPLCDVSDLRVAQTTRAPIVEPLAAQVEQWTEGLSGCIGTRGTAQSRSDGHGGTTRSSEFTPGQTVVHARPRRQPIERMERPQSTPPVFLRVPAADNTSGPTGTSPKFMPLIRTRSILSRLTGKAKVVSSPVATSLGVPGGATGGAGLVRSNTTGRHGAFSPGLNLL